MQKKLEEEILYTLREKNVEDKKQYFQLSREMIRSNSKYLRSCVESRAEEDRYFEEREDFALEYMTKSAGKAYYGRRSNAFEEMGKKLMALLDKYPQGPSQSTSKSDEKANEQDVGHEVKIVKEPKKRSEKWDTEEEGREGCVPAQPNRKEVLFPSPKMRKRKYRAPVVTTVVEKENLPIQQKQRKKRQKRKRPLLSVISEQQVGYM